MTTTISILVFADNKEPIGAIQSLKVIEGGNNPKLEISRMRLSCARLHDVFGRSNFQASTQKYPMHIVVYEDKVETVRATNVWISGIASSYTFGEWVLSEGIEAECERVSGTKTYKSSLDE